MLQLDFIGEGKWFGVLMVEKSVGFVESTFLLCMFVV